MAKTSKPSRFKNSTDEYKYKQNRKIVISSAADRCAICGGYVDKTLKYPHPMSATADHIIPIKKGGTSDLDNLQLAHWICNRIKSDKLVTSAYEQKEKKKKAIGTRDLPHLLDLSKFRKKAI